ncbi:hypothetical protein PVK06_040893 [Gossypium arboreum]|uniref:Uncharacterized protein n=1 Tax=Gossypium arboreum TaxID=29729 RepID=A0ABR0N6P8_GOSAR|nr:hypothetical protein PVK06_040893 [Gossypium arboreum]
MLLDSLGEEELKELQKCPDKLEDSVEEVDQQQTLVLSLHTIKGSHGLHTIRFKASIGGLPTPTTASRPPIPLIDERAIVMIRTYRKGRIVVGNVGSLK